jgi:LuxR family maltose regulon positive regulatory protein
MTFAAENFARAADLVELAIPAMRRSRQEATLRRWLEALPDELVQVRPVLNVGYAGALLLGGELEGVEARLGDAERWLETTAGTDVGPEGSSATWSSSTTRNFAASQGLSSCIALPRPCLGATCSAP